MSSDIVNSSHVIIPHVREAPKVKKAPDIPLNEAKNWLIHFHYVRKDYDSCIKLVREELARSKGQCEYAMYVQALITRLNGNIQESLDMFHCCAVLNPSNPENLKQVGRSLFLLARHKAAIDIYNEVLKISPDDWEIYHNLGICYQFSQDNAKAISAFETSLTLSKQDETYIALGKVQLLSGDVQGSINTYKAAIQNSPENSTLLSLLGLLYMKENDYQKAFENLGQAIIYSPTYVPAILAASSMMQLSSDVDVALSKYRIAAHEEPENPALWNNIGVCFFSKKKYVAAVSCLKRAVYLSPFNWKILYNLGLVHVALKQYASAFNFLSAGLNLKPKQGMFFMLLAVTLTHLEDPENAQASYEQALLYEKIDPSVSLNYAVFLYNKGDKSGSAKKHADFEHKLRLMRETNPQAIEESWLTLGKELGATLHVGTDYESSLLKKTENTQAHILQDAPKDPFENSFAHPPPQLPMSSFESITKNKGQMPPVPNFEEQSDAREFHPPPQPLTKMGPLYQPPGLGLVAVPKLPGLRQVGGDSIFRATDTSATDKESSNKIDDNDEISEEIEVLQKRALFSASSHAK